MTTECICCGLTREIEARGLCSACRGRTSKYGTLRSWGWVKSDRVAEYAGLREAGNSVEYAAWSAGVSVRTGQRYEAELRRDSAGWPLERKAAA